jgi:sugar phosphate permease
MIMLMNKRQLLFIAIFINSTTKAFVHSSHNHYNNMAVKPHEQIHRGGGTRLKPPHHQQQQQHPHSRPKTVLVNDAVAVSTQDMMRIVETPTTSFEPTNLVVSSGTSAAALVAPQPTTIAARITEQLQKLLTIDTIVCTAYLCSILGLSLPYLLMPMAATERVGAHASNLVASRVASMSSVAAIGGATGMFINGFVCQQMGSARCSKWYLIGQAFCSLVFGCSSSTAALGMASAGMEFFASVQGAALAVMLTDHYKDNAIKLAAAITALGLSNTIGEILAKVMGTTLMGAFHWRTVSHIGALVALVGAAAISRAPQSSKRQSYQHQQLTSRSEAAGMASSSSPSFQLSSVVNSLKEVLGSGLFWKLALAYSMAFVASCTDRVLGPFYHAVTGLNHSVSGFLTSSVSLGLIYGLLSASNKIAEMPTLQAKTKFFSHRYVHSVAATLGLTALAIFGGAIPRVLSASAIALLSFGMASNVAFQCYQFPAMIAQKFSDHQAVVISFLDGFGYLLSVPIYAVLGQMVPRFGWSSGWLLLATLFAGAGVTMMKSIPPILQLDSDMAEKEKEA